MVRTAPRILAFCVCVSMVLAGCDKPPERPAASTQAPSSQAPPVAVAPVPAEAATLTTPPEPTIEPSQVQAGYKSFKWGQAHDEIAAVVPDLSPKDSSISEAIGKAYFYEYADRYEREIPNPAQLLRGEMKDYKSDSIGVTFMFLDDRLFGVLVSFFNAPVADDLQSKYGSRPIRTTSRDMMVRAWEQPGRVIVWESLGGKNPFGQLDEVYYFDSSVYAPIARQTLAAREIEMKGEKGKLD